MQMSILGIVNLYKAVSIIYDADVHAMSSLDHAITIKTKIDDENQNLPPRGKHLFRSRRFFIVFLLCLGTYCSAAYRNHIGVALVCMVNATAVYKPPEIDNNNIPEFDEDENCPRLSVSANRSTINDYKGTFIWTSEEQSLVVSAGYYGNLIAVFIGGYVVDKYGPKIVNQVGITSLIIVLCLFPFFANWSVYGAIGLRSIGGVFEAPMLPCYSAIVARWFPTHERSTVAALYSAGMNIASSLGVIISSNLCKLDFFGGWPLIFYLTATICFIYGIFWYLFASNYPSQSRLLSDDEKNFLYLENEQFLSTYKQRKNAGQKMPLKAMLTSPAVWGMALSQFSITMNNSLLSAYLPTYARDVLRLDLRSNGLFAAVPFAMQLVGKIVLSLIADEVKKRKILSQTASCRVFQSIAFTGSTLTFLLLGFYITCNHVTQASIIMAVYGFLFGANIPGAITAGLSIAPSFTGMVTSFKLAFAVFGAFLPPALVGLIVKHGELSEWQTLFSVFVVFNILAGVQFVFIGSADIQPWARPPAKVQVSPLPEKKDIDYSPPENEQNKSKC